MSLTHTPLGTRWLPGIPFHWHLRPRQPGWGVRVSLLHPWCEKGPRRASLCSAGETQIKSAGSLRRKEVYCGWWGFSASGPKDELQLHFLEEQRTG